MTPELEKTKKDDRDKKKRGNGDADGNDSRQRCPGGYED